MTLDELKEQIKDYILHSEEYIKYKSLDMKISTDLELKRKADELRRQNFTLRLDDDADEIAQLQQSIEMQYGDDTSIQVVQYIMAEGRLCNLIRNICETACDAADIDTGFLTD